MESRKSGFDDLALGVLEKFAMILSMDRLIGEDGLGQIKPIIRPDNVGSDRLFNNNLHRQQKVLPDTILIALNADYKFFNSRAFQELPTFNWQALEFHDIQDLPYVNVNFVKDDRKAREIFFRVTGKMRRMIELFGYNKRQVSPLSVYIAPQRYYFKGADAFMNLKAHNLWISSQRALYLDHELGHWATTYHEDMRSMLLIEGIANWGAWQVKSDREKRQSTLADYLQRSRVIWTRFMKRENLKLDGNYENRADLARDVGGVLFDVIFEELGSDAKVLGSRWIASLAYSQPSEWLREIGLDPEKIETKWRDHIFGKQHFAGS